MQKTIPAIVLLSVFAAPSLFAQNSNSGRSNRQPNIGAMVQRQVKRLTTLLDLTSGQQSSLTDLLTQNATANQPLMTGMRTARQALRAAEENNDSASIQSASNQIGSITGQLTANRATLNAGIAQILSSEQLTKYKALGPLGFARGFRGPRGSGGPA